MLNKATAVSFKTLTAKPIAVPSVAAALATVGLFAMATCNRVAALRQAVAPVNAALSVTTIYRLHAVPI